MEEDGGSEMVKFRINFDGRERFMIQNWGEKDYGQGQFQDFGQSNWLSLSLQSKCKKSIAEGAGTKSN